MEGMMNDKALKLHICEECAKKEGIDFNFIKPNFSIIDLLSNLSDWEIPGHKTSKSVVCPGCGLNYNQFKQTGRLGCANCYTAFALQLSPLLKRIHGSCQHTGKKPGEQKPPATESAALLKKLMQEAVRNEEFEKAADIRDRLKDLENTGKKGIRE